MAVGLLFLFFLFLMCKRLWLSQHEFRCTRKQSYSFSRGGALHSHLQGWLVATSTGEFTLREDNRTVIFDAICGLLHVAADSEESFQQELSLWVKVLLMLFE